VIIGLIVFFTINEKQDFGVVDFDEENNGENKNIDNIENGSNVTNNDSNSDDVNSNENIEHEDEDVLEFIEDFKEKNSGFAPSEKDIETFKEYKDGKLDQNDERWLYLKKPLFKPADDFGDAPETMVLNDINLTLKKPVVRRDLFDDKEVHLTPTTRFGEDYMSVKTMGRDMGFLNINTGEAQIIDESVDSFKVNPNSTEFVYVKSYGTSGDLFYGEIGPSGNDLVQSFDTATSLVSAAFYDDMVFYSYKHIDEAVYTSGSNFYNIVAPKSEVEKFSKIFEENHFDLFGSDGETLFGYNIEERTLYNLTNGNLKVEKKFPDVETIGAILVRDGEYAFTSSINGENHLISSLSEEPLKLFDSFIPRTFVTDDIVIGTAKIGEYHNAALQYVALYNFSTNGYEILTGSVALTADDDKIYILFNGIFAELEFEGH